MSVGSRSPLRRHAKTTEKTSLPSGSANGGSHSALARSEGSPRSMSVAGARSARRSARLGVLGVGVVGDDPSGEPEETVARGEGGVDGALGCALDGCCVDWDGERLQGSAAVRWDARGGERRWGSWRWDERRRARSCRWLCEPRSSLRRSGAPSGVPMRGTAVVAAIGGVCGGVCGGVESGVRSGAWSGVRSGVDCWVGDATTLPTAAGAPMVLASAASVSMPAPASREGEGVGVAAEPRSRRASAAAVVDSGSAEERAAQRVWMGERTASSQGLMPSPRRAEGCCRAPESRSGGAVGAGGGGGSRAGESGA